uniref:Uncharacterized protein n=1 Tax=Anopheles arabiensis TaxID=7173 RepID=A0A182IGQ4_ANOAR
MGKGSIRTHSQGCLVIVSIDGRGSVHRRVAADVGRLQGSGIGDGSSLVRDGSRGSSIRVGLGNWSSISVGLLHRSSISVSLGNWGSSVDGLDRGSIHSRSSLDVGRLLDRRRHDGLLHGRGEHGLSDLLVVILGEALVRVASRDGLLDRANVRHGRLLHDALLVRDLLLGDDGGRSSNHGRVGERARVHQVGTGSGSGNGENNGQHHQSEHFE